MRRISIELVSVWVVVLVEIELHEGPTSMILFMSASRNRMLSLIWMTRILNQLVWRRWCRTSDYWWSKRIIFLLLHRIVTRLRQAGLLLLLVIKYRGSNSHSIPTTLPKSELHSLSGLLLLLLLRALELPSCGCLGLTRTCGTHYLDLALAEYHATEGICLFNTHIVIADRSAAVPWCGGCRLQASMLLLWLLLLLHLTIWFSNCNNLL